jgi:hypothetical protein
MTGSVSQEDKTLEAWTTTDGVTVFEIKESGVTTATFEDGAIGSDAVVISDAAVQNIRVRKLAADIDTGFDLLPAIAGKSYRIISCSAEAYGDAVTASTSIDISGDDGSAATLFSFARGDLIENAMLLDATATTLAAGASYVANTAGTAISAKTVGTAIATATGIDFIVTYVIE